MKRTPTIVAVLLASTSLLASCASDDQATSPVEPTPVVVESSSAVDLPELRTLWDFRDPAGSESRFREVARKADAADRREYFAEALTQLARTQGLQKRFDEARRTLDLAEQAIRPGMERARVRLLLERGRVTNSSGDRVGSRPYFVEAYEVAMNAGEEALALDAAHMMGIVADGEEQLRWSVAAIEVAEASEDPRLRGWLGPLYNNTGWTLLERGDAAGALELWEKGLAFRRAAGRPGPVRIARYTVARAQRALGEHAVALATVREVLAEDAAAGSPDEMLGFYHEEIAENLHALGRTDEARPHFALAHEDLSRVGWLVKDEPERVERLRRLAERP